MMNARTIGAAIAGGRVALGLGLALAPGTVGRGWIGPDSKLPGGKVAVRATGVRDVAVGLGYLMALRRGRPTRGWLEAGMVSDIGDVVFAVMAFRHLPPLGRIVTLASAAGAAVVASRLAPVVDADA